VDDWSEERLEEWARVNITKDTVPQLDWHQKQVAIWARKVLNFSVKSAKFLIAAELDTKAVLAYKDDETLLRDYKRAIEQDEISPSSLRKLWAEIKKMKSLAEPAPRDNPMQDLISNYSSLNIGTSDQILTEFQKSCQSIANVRTPKKSIAPPYSMSPAAKRVVYKVNDLGLPIVVERDIANLTANEKICIILTELPNKISLKKAIAKIKGPNEIVMPLSDRMESKKQVMEFFQGNFTAVFEENDDKIFHSFCTAIGGSGSGKTRICKEIISWCQEFVSQKSKITSFVSIYIDFSNGDSLGSTDASATHIIGQRIAARAIYQCSGTELTSTLYRHQDVLQLFDFNTVMEAIRSRQPDGVCAILLILDEFNYVVKRDQAIADSIIQNIGSFMTESCNTKDTILFPVIAGTVEGQVNQSFVNSGYRRQSLTLPPLSFESIETVFKACLPVAHHKWLDFMPFRRTLLLMCSTPRALYLVLTSLAATRDEPSLPNVQAVALALQQALTKKVSQTLDTLFNTDGFRELIQFVLAGTHFSLIKQKTKLVESLEIQGILYRRGESVFLPYHVVFNANSAYGTYESVRSLRPLVDPQVIPNPGARFTWQMFEHLDHALDPVRVAALRIIKPTQARLNELFKGALFNDKTGELVLYLSPVVCATESSHFIPKKIKPSNFTGISVRESSLPIAKDNVFDYAFMCHTGNPHIDSRMFFRTVAKPIMLVKQLKHLEQAENLTTIPFLYVENWFKLTRKKLSNLSETYNILFMFITNKKITGLPHFWPENLIIVHADNIDSYYGPFVAQLAQLTTFKLENEEPNPIESDDEEYWEYNDSEDEV
jgi:hypothetical protein